MRKIAQVFVTFSEKLKFKGSEEAKVEDTEDSDCKKEDIIKTIVKKPTRESGLLLFYFHSFCSQTKTES